jgi:carbohydrate diacid regulator
VLTASLAQEVARELAAVTDLGILITDRDAEVIGSSDPKRIGSFHEASLDVVATGRPASHTAEQAALLRGVRPGMTLPIIVDGEAVGTVGITGAPARLRRFGPIVARHTEILLRESAVLRTQLLRERGIEDLVRDIASYDPELIEPRFLHARAAELGFTLDVPRAAAVFGLRAEAIDDRARRPDASVLRAEIVRLARQQCGGTGHIVAATRSGHIAVLYRLPGAADDVSTSEFRATCERVLDVVAQRYQLHMRVGVAGVGNTLVELRSALQDATDALVLGSSAMPRRRTHAIEELRLHQLLSSAGHRSRTRLVASELDALRAQPDWLQLRHTLVTWSECRFNLIEAARTLHIHRNTLRYRIAKIETLSGRSLQDPVTRITTYLACLADQIDG